MLKNAFVFIFLLLIFQNLKAQEEIGWPETRMFFKPSEGMTNTSNSANEMMFSCASNICVFKVWNWTDPDIRTVREVAYKVWEDMNYVEDKTIVLTGYDWAQNNAGLENYKLVATFAQGEQTAKLYIVAFRDASNDQILVGQYSFTLFNDEEEWNNQNADAVMKTFRLEE